MNTFNINQHVTLEGDDKWLLYQVDKINFYTDEDRTETAYCFSDKGKFSIFISKDLLAKDNAFKVELIKHELAHGMFQHLSFNVGKTELERKLFNILADCSIHVSCADGIMLQGVTYENMKLPVLPPELLFNKLKPKINQMQDWIEDNLPDTELLWDNEAEKVESQIISQAIQTGLEEAQAEGCTPSKEFTTVGGSEQTDFEQDHEFMMMEYKKPDWLSQVLRIVKDFSNPSRERTYRREHRNPVDDSILTKGYGNIPDSPDLVFAIDCSGSMSPYVVDRAISQLVQFVPDSRVILFDTKVTDVFKLHQKAQIMNAIKSYWGGTDIRPVLDIVNKRDKLIIFTDGGFNTFRFDTEGRSLVYVLTDNYYEYRLEKTGKVILAK